MVELVGVTGANMINLPPVFYVWMLVSFLEGKDLMLFILEPVILRIVLNT